MTAQTSAHASAATFKGAHGKKIKNQAAARKIFSDPRQQFWPGLPPRKHRAPGFEKLPGVNVVAFSGGFAKYSFNPDGSKTYIYYEK